MLYQLPLQICRLVVEIMSYPGYYCPYPEEQILFRQLEQKNKIRYSQFSPSNTSALLTSIANRFYQVANFLYLPGYELEIIAVLPWLNLLNSDHNMRELFAFGVKTIYPIPRSYFRTRVQLALWHLSKGSHNNTQINSILHTIPI